MAETHWWEMTESEKQDVIAEVCREIKSGVLNMKRPHLFVALQAIAADYEKRHPEIF